MSISTIKLNPQALHTRLAKYNISRVAVGTPTVNWEDDISNAYEHHILEGHFLEELRVAISPITPEPMPTGEDFAIWFESLSDCGPGQQHGLFEWLEQEASLEQMKWFLTQEAIAEVGFDDLLAYTQVKLPVQAKQECARNYWDEMGNAKQGAMHSLLLKRVTHGLLLRPSIDTTVWESLALNNMMLGLATTRRYTYHSLGALGVNELVAASCAGKISRGLQRLGIEPWVRTYFDLQAALDVSHSRCWIREVIRPLVTSNPECAQYIAEGALMRMHSSQLCFDRYSVELGLKEDSESASFMSQHNIFRRN
jgi:hypothetical protein